MGEGVADGGISKQDDLASLMPQDLYKKQRTPLTGAWTSPIRPPVVV